MDLVDRASAAYVEEYGGPPHRVAQAPGRVELLGNHTDYNGGLVLSAGIDRHTVVAAGPRTDRLACLFSLDLAARDQFHVDHQASFDAAWTRYPRGVVWALRERFGPLRSGFNAVILGDVPQGAGLSSSASLEAALAWACLGLGLIDLPINDSTRMDLARTLQRAENVYVGVACGLLDQFSTLFAAADSALMLDCANGHWERLSLVDDQGSAPAIVVCDSRTSRRLADGMYNRRRTECETVLDHYRQLRGNSLRWLRDLRLEDLERDWLALDPVGRRRARHVLTENQRVETGRDALQRADLKTFGRLMSESHESSRLDFENSSEGLDRLIEAAREAPGFLGGKLSGAGWAGCTVNLVQAAAAADFASAVRDGVLRRGGPEPRLYVCRPAPGAGILEPR
jgi:galactokinase